jgi:peptidoglycan/LPS O-acetylase OafA/YrhL
LYHAGVFIFPGGYVGVDIFFVISGYLITSIIYGEIQRGEFSLTDFYDRRIRRILPALAAVIIPTTIAAWFLLMPVDFKEYGESLTALSVFSSNIYLDLKSGYFDQTASLRPLLHTWSLSIEEQYYAFFPLLLLLLVKFAKKYVKIVCVVLWAISLGLSIKRMHFYPTSAFYIIWYRAWELFTGSLIALEIVPDVRRMWARHALSLAGAAMIVGAIALYTKSTPFPGATALPPVIGAGLIIYAGRHGPNMVSRALSLRPVVFVGLVSYSFYLWHWPLMVFVRYATMRDLTLAEGLLLSLLAFGLAVLSWRFVERPFRRRRGKALGPVFAAAAVCIAVGIGFGVAARVGKGWPQRLPPAVAQIASVGLDFDQKRTVCDGRSPAQLAKDDVCFIGSKTAPADFVLLGDSFAGAFSPGVDAMAQVAGRRGYDLTRGGCVPMLKTDIGGVACGAFLDSAIALINRHPEIKTVILVGRWTTVSEGKRFGVDQDSDMLVSDAETKAEGYAENRRVLERGLERTLAALSSKQVFVTAFVPEQAVNVPQAMAINKYFHNDKDVSVRRDVFDARQAFVRQLLSSLQARYHFTILDVSPFVCNAIECVASRNGTPIYVDDNHFSRTAAIAMKDIFAPALDPAAKGVKAAT